jgi:Putative phage abortive infection protein
MIEHNATGTNQKNILGQPKTIWSLAGITVIVWAVFLFCGFKVATPQSFGEVLESATALFSALTFAGLIYTIILQRHELQLQRRELAQTRRELKEQNRHFDQQNNTLRQQAADSTFFHLLELHNDIVKAIDLRSVKDGQIIAQGRDCFRSLYNDFVSIYKEELELGTSEFASMQKAYLTFYENRQADLGHYFRSLYNIVKFIDRSEFDDKRIYSNLVRAQLSSYEQTLLFYNCISKYGEEKFKPLVETYGLLKHVPRELLVHQEPKLNYYAAIAYS